MRLVVPFVAAVLVGSADLTAQAPTDPAAVLTAFHNALSAGDSLTALGFLADDLVVLESGSRESLADYRSHHLPADIRFARAVPSNRAAYDVTVVGDVAWAVGTSTTTGTMEGRPVDSAGAELVVLSRSGATWKIRAIHWSSRRRQNR